MASEFHTGAKLLIAQQQLNLVTAQLKVMLVDDTYVDDPARDFVDDGTDDDPASHEIAVSGYGAGFGGAGRKLLANKALARDDGTGVVRFTFDPVVWANLGEGVRIGGAVIILEAVDDAGSRIVAFDDTNDPLTNGGNITYQPAAGGLLQF